jgi:hypothetical protein
MRAVTIVTSMFKGMQVAVDIINSELSGRYWSWCSRGLDLNTTDIYGHLDTASEAYIIFYDIE